MSKFDEIMNYYAGNKFAYSQLLKRIKENKIVPFIGAGLSNCCYPAWDKMFEGMLTSVSYDTAKIVKKKIDAYDYFSAADILCDKMGELLFYESVREIFAESLICEEKIKNQAIFLLPQFQFQTYITTNYDRVLEKAFSYNHINFEVGFPYDIYKLSSYMRNTIFTPMILKIHGDIRSDKENLILTGNSYKIHYQDGTCLKEQLSKWVESKNLLFLGASLYKDKTMSIIAERMQEGMVNYAIMGIGSNEFDSVKDRIKSINAIPIFYNCADHNNLRVIIEQLLNDMKK